MTLACLDNLIGVRGECESTTPLSGLYLNDLPYITTENANKTVERDDNSGFQLMSRAIERAQGYLVNDIHQKLQPKFKYNSVLSNQTIGYYQDTYRTVTGTAGYYKGIVIEINENPHLELFLSSISLFITQSTTVTVKVFDLIDGKEIGSVDVATTANTITTQDIFFQIPNLRQKQRIFIGYLSTGITSYQTLIHENFLGCNGCGGSYFKNQWLYTKNGKLDDSAVKVYPNLENANDTGGISVDYSLNCSLSKVLCGIRNLLSYSLLYRSATEFLFEMQTTKRYNTAVIKLETINEAQAQYEQKYMESLENVLENLVLPNSICFNCNSAINLRTTIP